MDGVALAPSKDLNPAVAGGAPIIRQSRLPEVCEVGLSVRRADAAMPVFEMQSMQQTVDEALFNERMLALLSASFGLLATVLAAVLVVPGFALLYVLDQRGELEEDVADVEPMGRPARARPADGGGDGFITTG